MPEVRELIGDLYHILDRRPDGVARHRAALGGAAPAKL